jgi:hypothetical protein
MTRHLTRDEITAVIAGLPIGDAANEHLESCVACRSQLTGFADIVSARRATMTADEPEWETAAAAVMARLPEPDAAAGGSRRPRWLRPVLALAAAIVVAVAVGVLMPDRQAVQPQPEDIAVEEILAEMDELLSDDRIPGFEAIDPGLDDLSAYIDNGAS